MRCPVSLVNWQARCNDRAVAASASEILSGSQYCPASTGPAVGGGGGLGPESGAPGAPPATVLLPTAVKPACTAARICIPVLTLCGFEATAIATVCVAASTACPPAWLT